MLANQPLVRGQRRGASLLSSTARVSLLGISIGAELLLVSFSSFRTQHVVGQQNVEGNMCGSGGERV